MKQTDTVNVLYLRSRNWFCYQFSFVGVVGSVDFHAHFHVHIMLNNEFLPCFVVFQEHHEEDLFLYLTYSNESVYGAWGRKKKRLEREWEETKWGREDWE